jgi:hypothetical protein
MQPRNTIPLNASGYFSTLAQANLNLAENVNRRRMGFSQLLEDMGMRSRNGQIVPDWGNRFGAYAEGSRAAATDTAARGFGPSKDMQRLAFAPTRREILKQTSRARGEMRFENEADRMRKKQILVDAARNAAQYGYENRQPKERR